MLRTTSLSGLSVTATGTTSIEDSIPYPPQKEKGNFFDFSLVYYESMCYYILYIVKMPEGMHYVYKKRTR